MRVFISVVAATVTILAFLAITYVGQFWKFDLNGIVGAFGTVLGAFGVTFGAYFALLAVDAYGQLKVVKEASEQARRSTVEISKAHTDVVSFAGAIYRAGDAMFDNFQRFLVLTRNGNRKRGQAANLTEELAVSRARYKLLNPILDDKEVFSQMAVLATMGDLTDVELLINIASDSSKSTDIRQQAKSFCEVLKKRLALSSSRLSRSAG